MQLKKGFMITLLRNLCPKRGHVNGARYIVEHMSSNLLHLKFAVGWHAGSHLTLSRVPCRRGDDNVPVLGFKRRQLPVQVCFWMTINKAKGQSFGGKLGIASLRTTLHAAFRDLEGFTRLVLKVFDRDAHSLSGIYSGDDTQMPVKPPKIVPFANGYRGREK